MNFNLDQIEQFALFCEFMEWQYLPNTQNLYLKAKNSTIPTKFNFDHNDLHKIWVKFRDLKIENIGESNKKIFGIEPPIGLKILFGTIEEAFTAIANAIKWYNTIQL